MFIFPFLFLSISFVVLKN
uniref:Uncharacterized protein n=1 Tax=Rhizophora mucronata TaxID=61149 RepID=A0A2P2QP19_RHIMU